MKDLIASFIVQNGNCSLPRLGSFSTESKNAASDVASKIIYPPEIFYIFKEGDEPVTEDLINYISIKKNCSDHDARASLDNWMAHTEADLLNGEGIVFRGVGKLSRNSEGTLVLKTAKNNLQMPPVAAVRVIHENETHKVLVGDKESDSVIMNRVLNDEHESAPRKWWWPALIIFIIALLIYIFYWMTGGFGIHINAPNAPATYISK